MWHWLFGWWVRWQACKMAARVVAGWNDGPSEGLCPRLWSLTVFFENYMSEGAAGTRADFGPPDAEVVHLIDKQAPA